MKSLKYINMFLAVFELLIIMIKKMSNMLEDIKNTSIVYDFVV